MKITTGAIQLVSIGLLANTKMILAATCGNGNRGDGICANNMCCSQWGWCGTTSEYCSGGGTVPSPSPPTTFLGDWAFCSSSSQCLNKCCSKEYSTSDGKYKCTPGGKQCLSSPSPPTPTSTGGGSSLLGNWAICSSNSQCLNNCCSKEYSTSDGKYKCTPGGSKCTGSGSSPPSPSPPTPTSTGGTSLYKGSSGGTYYYYVSGKFCSQDGGPYAENQGYPSAHCMTQAFGRSSRIMVQIILLQLIEHYCPLRRGVNVTAERKSKCIRMENKSVVVPLLSLMAVRLVKEVKGLISLCQPLMQSIIEMLAGMVLYPASVGMSLISKSLLLLRKHATGNYCSNLTERMMRFDLIL
eukprot:CCRYP_010789-RB/>CCRYP_010789-RB protein AED:0.05 eAED:0.05 QI:452/1/1/1/0.33/0.25/4/120/352